MLEKDLTCGSLSDAPNDNYRKFFEKFKEIETLETKDWKPTHVLAYFTKKYYDTYKVKYKFKFNSPSPSKCFEIFQIKKLASCLTADPVLLKEYINWVFKNKVTQAKRRLTSISFMTVEGVMNEYKFNVLLNSKNDNGSINRTTPLPDNIKDIFHICGYIISTYGELAFLNQMTDKSVDLNNAFTDAQDLGLDINILNRVV
jgi:hypothetical protein